MATFTVGSIAHLEKLIRKHNKARVKRAKKAIVRVAKKGRQFIIKHTLPIAFRTLERSIHVEVSADRIAIVADAPHAAAVEVGSRPHTPPLAPLIEWVTLRGMQGEHNQTHKGAAKFKRGTTTKAHSERVIAELDAIRASNPDTVSVIAVAKAIQRAIAARGTKPQWFMRSALPEINELLDREIRMALEDKEQQSAPFSEAAAAE